MNQKSEIELELELKLKPKVEHKMKLRLECMVHACSIETPFLYECMRCETNSAPFCFSPVDR